MPKFGFSFSWKRALGISAAKARVSRAIGIPLTKQGRQRKYGQAMGCVAVIVFFALSVFGLEYTPSVTSAAYSSPVHVVSSSSYLVAKKVIPKGATALCKDGTYSFALHHQGSCSHHHGVAKFYK